MEVEENSSENVTRKHEPTLKWINFFYYLSYHHHLIAVVVNEDYNGDVILQSPWKHWM